MYRVTVWDELRQALRQIRAEQPEALLSYPDPDDGDQRNPPFFVNLAPWVTAVAEDLNRRFGSDVTLRVGGLSYPSGASVAAVRGFGESLAPAPGNEVSVELDGPLTVRSGHTADHGLLVTNQTEAELAIHSKGQLTAKILDLASGRVVGGFAGAQRLPLKVFQIPAGETTRIPLLVGTASFRPELGYAIPPGRWGLTADLRLNSGRLLRLPTLFVDVLP